MIYVVKCFYCEHEFKVKRGETGADMMCPHCGTTNNIRDVIERIEDESGKVDYDMQAIKNFEFVTSCITALLHVRLFLLKQTKKEKQNT